MRTRYALLFSFLFILISCGEEKKKTEEIPVKKEEVPVVVKQETVKAPVISYTVQIAAFKSENKKFASISNVHSARENGFMKYRLGSFPTYKEARKYRRTILSAYPGAFVQALKDGNSIQITEALNR